MYAVTAVLYMGTSPNLITRTYVIQEWEVEMKTVKYRGLTAATKQAVKRGRNIPPRTSKRPPSPSLVRNNGQAGGTHLTRNVLYRQIFKGILPKERRVVPVNYTPVEIVEK